MIGGVVNEFSTTQILVNTDPKEVYLVDSGGNHSSFRYDIHCHVKPLSTKFNFFFQVNTGKMLVIFADQRNYKCGIMRFWVRNDEPQPAVEWLSNMTAMIKAIQPQFAEQLASYSLDKIINSPDSESV